MAVRVLCPTQRADHHGDGQHSALNFAVNGLDPNGDPIGDVSKFVTLTSNYSTDVIHGASVEMTASGYHTVTATWDTGGSDVSSSVNVMVNPASATHVVIEGMPASIPADTLLLLGASTADEFGNLISDVTSSATFASNVSSDAWHGSSVVMTQVGEHSISLTVPGYQNSEHGERHAWRVILTSLSRREGVIHWYDSLTMEIRRKRL